VERDVYRSIVDGATLHPPSCPKCAHDPMAWIPAVGSMDAYEPFQAFETTDGRGNPVTITSLRKLRQVERESEQAERNGEGQRMVWRQYSQDPSNRHSHTLMPSDPTPKITGKTRRGEPLVREILPSEGGQEPAVQLGEGIVGESPLPLEPGG
jgi:hypothetical protein